MIDAPLDTGKYVMGIFEGGKETDGVEVQAPSLWTSPKEIVFTLSKVTGQDMVDFRDDSRRTSRGMAARSYPVGVDRYAVIHW